MATPASICVIGGTGMLGRAIVGQALEAGHRVVVATRTPASASGRLPDGVEVRRGDLTQLTSLPDVVRDVEVVIASAHGMLGRGASRSELVDDRGHRALIDAAKSADVGSFVYVSVMGASPAHSVDFWRTKAGIEAYLRASGLRFTIVRPAAFMEMHAHTLIGQAILAGGTANILGRGDVRMNFVAVRDVAAVIVRALRDPALHNQAVEVGGPENLTQNEVAALYGRIAGREPKVRHVPYELVHVLATVLGAFHPGIARIMRASLAARATDQTFDPSALLSAHPMVLTRLEDVARELAAGTSAGARGGGASVSSSSP